VARTLVDLDPHDAVEDVLEDVQDTLSEELTVPWPHDPSRGYAFHAPGVARTEGAIELWYGPRERPVLGFDPIPLSELDLS
jgi:hypothetical protein